MRTPTAPTDPWGNEIDNGWRDLVVSSAPPPPPREVAAQPTKNPSMPANLTAWQEHGSAHTPSLEAPVDEPNFTGDRRLWVVAGALMALATVVLGLLGMLTFGGAASEAVIGTAHAIIAPAAAPAVAPAPAVAATHEPAQVATAVVATKPSPDNPRNLKRAKHARHHKRLATR